MDGEPMTVLEHPDKFEGDPAFGDVEIEDES